MIRGKSVGKWLHGHTKSPWSRSTGSISGGDIKRLGSGKPSQVESVWGTRDAETEGWMPSPSSSFSVSGVIRPGSSPFRLGSSRLLLLKTASHLRSVGGSTGRGASKRAFGSLEAHLDAWITLSRCGQVPWFPDVSCDMGEPVDGTVPRQPAETKDGGTAGQNMGPACPGRSESHAFQTSAVVVLSEWGCTTVVISSTHPSPFA